MELVKRTWCYVQQPKVYCLSPCKCGNEDVQWSEWQKHLWCEKCQIDFIPECDGIFDGPIPVGAATLMGICFDRINLETNEIEKFQHKSIEELKQNGLLPNETVV